MRLATSCLRPGVALILLIDDDGFYRGLLRQILEDGGHQVAEAANGVDGLQRFQSQQPDLVITDMRMPGFTAARSSEGFARRARMFAFSPYRASPPSTMPKALNPPKPSARMPY